jgi:hypothetical protein
MGKIKKVVPQSHATHQVHKLPKTDALERFPNFAMRSSSVQHLCHALSVFMSSGNSVARPLGGRRKQPGAGGPLPKRKQKVDVCFAKTFIPSLPEKACKAKQLPHLVHLKLDFILFLCNLQLPIISER